MPLVVFVVKDPTDTFSFNLLLFVMLVFPLQYIEADVDSSSLTSVHTNGESRVSEHKKCK